MTYPGIDWLDVWTDLMSKKMKTSLEELTLKLAPKN
jgi:hypothetical protein